MAIVRFGSAARELGHREACARHRRRRRASVSPRAGAPRPSSDEERCRKRARRRQQGRCCLSALSRRRYLRPRRHRPYAGRRARRIAKAVRRGREPTGARRSSHPRPIIPSSAPRCGTSTRLCRAAEGSQLLPSAPAGFGAKRPRGVKHSRGRGSARRSPRGDVELVSYVRAIDFRSKDLARDDPFTRSADRNQVSKSKNRNSSPGSSHV